MSKTPPVRTCVGCRERGAKSDLLRVVAVASGQENWSVVADEQARRPGRGAYVHLTPECLDRAERRRAFSRALRLEGALDVTVLREMVEDHRQPSAEGSA
jgi:predicted RNA-binding protein YlxR (DUF448 family)